MTFRALRSIGWLNNNKSTLSVVSFTSMFISQNSAKYMEMRRSEDKRYISIAHSILCLNQTEKIRFQPKSLFFLSSVYHIESDFPPPFILFFHSASPFSIYSIPQTEKNQFRSHSRINFFYRVSSWIFNTLLLVAVLPFYIVLTF